MIDFAAAPLLPHYPKDSNLSSRGIININVETIIKSDRLSGRPEAK